jgi:imidazolonepropionase-like amidohydrolase
MNMDTIIMEATGLDGWAHSSPKPVSAENNRWMADNDRFVIVTANVGEMLSGMRVADEQGDKSMLQESLIVDIWGKDIVNQFYKLYPRIRHEFYEGPNSFYQQNNFGDMSKIRANFFPNIKGAYDAGVLIAGGSDFPYPSLWAGEAMHREMELLVMAGIPAVDAIRICTHNASKILGHDDEFGSLVAGLSADILIVDGNPAENISDSRNVRYVFSQGRLVDRDSLRLKN